MLSRFFLCWLFQRGSSVAVLTCYCLLSVTGHRELIIFPIELHSSSTFFCGQELISGYSWASEFCVSSKARLGTAK